MRVQLIFSVIFNQSSTTSSTSLYQRYDCTSMVQVLFSSNMLHAYLNFLTSEISDFFSEKAQMCIPDSSDKIPDSFRTRIFLIFYVECVFDLSCLSYLQQVEMILLSVCLAHSFFCKVSVTHS